MAEKNHCVSGPMKGSFTANNGVVLMREEESMVRRQLRMKINEFPMNAPDSLLVYLLDLQAYTGTVAFL